MNYKLFVLAALCIFSFGNVCAQPGPGGSMPGDKGPGDVKQKKEKKVKEQTGHRELNPYEIGKLPGQIYVFGFSQEFGDTIAYITDITKIDSIMLQKKTGFLPFRYDLSQQYKSYLESDKGLKKQTTCVFFSKNKKSLSKKLAKMKKRYLNMENTTVVTIKDDEFKFIHPLDAK